MESQNLKSEKHLRNNRARKRILYFVPQFPVLSETFIHREISKLVELGNLDVTVLSMASGTGHMPPNVKDHVVYSRLSIGVALSAAFSYILLHPLKILRIHKLITGKDRVPYLLSLKSDGSARTKLSVLGRFHNSRLVHFFKGIAYAKLFEKYKPDHIHVHFLSDTSTIVMVAAKILNVPFSVSCHAKDVFVEGSLVGVKAREAKFIAACNENAWKEVVRQANVYKKSGNVRLIFHGIDEEKLFSGADSVQKPNKPVIFLGGTRFAEKKGLKYMVEASKILKERGIAHQVDLMGPTSEPEVYTNVLRLVDEWNLQDTIKVHNEGKGTPNAVVAQYYKTADVFVFPAVVTEKGDVDGVPTVVIEAALAKLPIVATSVGSITDLVSKDTGILIPDKDPKAIADAVERVLNDGALADRLGNAAFAKAKDMFNLDRNVSELESLLLK